MKTGPLGGILEHLRGTLQKQKASIPDAQLLTRYLVEREESAFEAIVRRHGGMVLGVCRRILGDSHDAEDAFQATFLVLVRKARTIVPRAGLGGWLHGVARRTALKARTARARRMARQQPAPRESPAAEAEKGDWLDLQPILDQELTALAGIYRLPLVLCDLEGKSRKEAAQQLGWKEGTLSGRLARGRRLLASRLTHRGVTLSAAGLATVLAAQASAGPSPALLLSTVRAASEGLAAVAAPVAALTREVLHTMLLQKLKALSVVLLATLLTLGAAIGYSHVLGGEESDAGRQGDKDGAPIGLDRPRAEIAGKLYLYEGADLGVYDLGSKKTSQLAALPEKYRLHSPPEMNRLSPDGRFVAFGESGPGGMPRKILVADVNGRSDPRVVVDMPNELSSWSWSPDGKWLSFVVWSEKDQKYHPYLVDISTRKREEVKLPLLKAKGPEGWATVIHAWSPDGLWLVHSHGHFFLVDPKTQQARQLTDEQNGFLQGSARFSPDGKKVLFIGVNKEGAFNLSVIDLLLGKTTVLASLEGRWSYSACWSPDSRRIALASQEVDEKHKPSGPSRVEIYDVQEKKRARVVIEHEKGGLTVTDWRGR